MRISLIGAMVAVAVVGPATGDAKPQNEAHGRKVAKSPLRVEQSGKTGWYLRVSLPKDAQSDDRLVLVYASDKDFKRPAELILIPEGRLDKAVDELKALANKVNISAHQTNRFNNGAFDFWAEKNTFGNRGVYAVGLVSKKSVRVGVCVTYFGLSDWIADKKGAVEVPLPTSPPGGSQEYIPRSCDLSVWLVTNAGLRVAAGTARIVRK